MLASLGRHWGWVFAYSVIDIFTAISHREMPDRGWAAVTGVLSAIAGIIVFAFPA